MGGQRSPSPLETTKSSGALCSSGQLEVDVSEELLQKFPVFKYCSTTPLLIREMEFGCLQQQQDE